uniref:EF-hand domain-containing protein n=1 Tax=Panagrellus redivivus TaxID=6233 RepID=A0A7E4VAA9_PANRE
MTCSSDIDENIDERFDRLDANEDGYFDFNEFLFADVCAVALRRDRFNEIDRDLTDSIDWKEWELHSMQVDMKRRRRTLHENRMMFKFLDRNKSNKLEAREIRRYVRYRRCNPTNISKYLASKGTTGLAFHEFDKFTYVVPNKMFPLGRRNRTTPKVPYYGPGNCEKPESHKMEFHRLDTNRDRKISFTEYLYFERCPILRHRRKFIRMDRNHDKKIDIHEFRYYYKERDLFWKNVYDMRMNSIVHRYDQNNDMHLDGVELRNYLLHRDIDPMNLDRFLRGNVMSPKVFADWEETLPNALFPAFPKVPKRS